MDGSVKVLQLSCYFILVFIVGKIMNVFLFDPVVYDFYVLE